MPRYRQNAPIYAGGYENTGHDPDTRTRADPEHPRRIWAGFFSYYNRNTRTAPNNKIYPFKIF